MGKQIGLPSVVEIKQRGLFEKVKAKYRRGEQLSKAETRLLWFDALRVNAR